MAFIDFKDVSFSYEGSKKQILHGINLSIDEGDFVAVLGRNGSGKSTFAKLVNGLLQPTSGEVTVSGISTKDEDRRLNILQQVGMIFQNPDNQIVASIVEEDVAFGPENLGVPPDEIRQRVDNALKTVGMYDFKKNAPSNLSGGQKQRVAIAGILAMNTKCIVMDEATAMLDPRGREDVMSEVEKLNREQGITVIYITHFMEEATRANRVIVVKDGNFVLDGTPKEVFENYDLIKNMGLDVPQGYELMKKLGKNECVLTVDECTEALERLLKDGSNA